MSHRPWTTLACVVALTQALPGTAFADRRSAERNLSRLNLPEGYEISVYAEVPGARQMTVGHAMGTVFVGTRDDSVFAVVDGDRDGVADKTILFKDGLNAPSGVDFANGYLYVSEQHRLTRYAAAELDIERRDFQPEVLAEGFVDSSHHGTRYTRVGPDGRVYVAMGVPCNICMPKDDSDAIVRFAPDGSEREVFARGIRNSVGMDFHPTTGHLFFTDNGVDNLGDDVPPGEFNRATQAGQYFGFPYYAGGKAQHPRFENREPPQPVTFPEVEFQAHVAALGMHFYEGAMLPDSGAAFVAQHGSWNRTTPVGYRVMRIPFDGEGNPTGKEVFIDGWLPTNDSGWGRPVDVVELKDGSLLVSDDYQGVIYRVTYSGE